MSKINFQHKIVKSLLRKVVCIACLLPTVLSCTQRQNTVPEDSSTPETFATDTLVISRAAYQDRLYGFWLGQCIANWTGLITEMDKIGIPRDNGIGGGFYTRENWGGPDGPNIWEAAHMDALADTIDFYLVGKDGIWGADDDTDIEYMYQYLTQQSPSVLLTPERIREGWLTHIYADENTPFRNDRGEPENYLWVSNQTAHDLMREGVLPPATGDPARNPNYEMIDAQLTTEIFGLFAPGRPDIALQLAHLPIRTTARADAAAIAEFYVVMHALAATVDPALTRAEQTRRLAERARPHLAGTTYAAAMYDYVARLYRAGHPWEGTRDSLHERYQIRHADGYDIAGREPACHGCFAAGINFGASLVSWFYGEGDLRETIRIGTLAGWDSDNPTATWGGLLGFLAGKEGVEAAFGPDLSDRFYIHRTRGGFPNDGRDNFSDMARVGAKIVERVLDEMGTGRVEGDRWLVRRKALR